jgi:hypothetical protein
VRRRRLASRGFDDSGHSFRPERDSFFV